MNNQSTKKRPAKRVVSRILGMLRHHRALLFFSLFASFLSTASGISVPFLIGKAIDCIGNESSYMVKYLVLAGCAALTGCVFQYVSSVINNKVAFSFLSDLRKTAFLKLASLPVSYYDSHQEGDTLSRIISDAEIISDGLLLGFTQLFTGSLTILITLVTMFIMNPLIAAVIVVLTPISILVAGFIAKKSSAYFRKQAETRGKVTSYIVESVENLSTVRMTGTSDSVINGFDKINNELVKSSIDAIFLSALVNPSSRFVNSVIYAATAGIGGIFCVNGAITVGTLSVFLNYAGQYSRPFNEVSGVIAEFQNALASAERLFGLFDETEMSADNDKQLSKPIKGEVEFKNVTFGYPGGQTIYEGFSFHSNPGQKIAIVGPTGCGKTTLINLLMRFYDPLCGSIFIDGTDTISVMRGDLRENIGMVLQDTFIFTGTVRDNLCLSDANLTEEKMIDAAKKCHCHEFIMKMRDGYNTVISDSGSGLSDGQKQLICICRAMLSDPSVLVLDEATSSIDTRTEMMVQKAMDELIKGRTAFIVAHRLSTIVNSDVIIVIKDGRVAEQGTHTELMRENGLYADLYRSQFAH